MAVLLNSVPARYLNGLHDVRLCARADFTRHRRRMKVMRRRRKFAVAEAAGMYHPASHDSPASIELLLDNLFAGVPEWVLSIPFLRRMILASTFFHELGHHLHHTLAPDHHNSEDVADQWSHRLFRRFFLRRYWYLLPIIYPVAVGYRASKRSSRIRTAA